MIHIPMLMVMLFWPRYEKGEWEFGIPIPASDNTSFDGGRTWYWIAVMQHLVLSFLHLNTMVSVTALSGGGSLLPLSIEGFKMISILSQVLNFIIGMNLFGNAPPVSRMSQEDRIIKMWLIIEISLSLSLLLSNILGMMLKFRHWPDFGQISIELEMDYKLDYLASEDPQLIIGVLCQPFYLLATNLLLMRYFRNYQVIPGANDALKNAISEDTYSIIYTQELMQIV